MPNQLVTNAVKALPSGSTPALQAFLKTFLSGVDESDLEILDPVTLARAAESHWDLGRKRKKETTAVRIYTPSHDASDWAINRTVVDIVNDDMAFLVDSIAAEINRQGYLIHYLLHPIVDGVSHIHVQLQTTLTDDLAKRLEEALLEVCADIRLANRDWKAMLARLREARQELGSTEKGVPKEDLREYCDFLDYMYENNFTLLGYREYKFIEKNGVVKSQIVKNSGLGLLHGDRRPVFISGENGGLTDAQQKMRQGLAAISVSKTNRRSTVHRTVPLDVVAVKIYDAKGKVVGEKVFLGLLTSVTYSRSVRDIPYLRHKVRQVLESADIPSSSHDGRALHHILEKYPRDELFQTDVKDLRKIAFGILRLQERQRIALYTRKDPFGRYVSCLVYVPKDRFETRLRLQFQHILEKHLHGVCSNFYTTMDDSVYARVMFIIDIDPSKPGKFDVAAIQDLLRQAGRTWGERLADALLDFHKNEAKSTWLRVRYGEAFPVGYRETYTERQGVYDIEKIEQVLKTGKIALDLYRPEDCELTRLRLKVYHLDAPMTLSDVLPLLENMGLHILSELPFEIRPEGAERAVWVQDFLMETTGTARHVPLRDVKAVFEEALEHIWYGHAENDSLNMLAIKARMHWREIVILRTYVRYLHQIRYPFSRSYVASALTENPEISRLLVDLFMAWHNPANGDKAQTLAAGCAVAIDHALEKVESLDQDRILRSITALVEATMRTNFFQPDEKGAVKTCLSVKLSSRLIADLPEPKPFMEIFVYSPRMEGIHLRGDRIARGGIRWSDRREDFRTEILGLMKAQQVKNSVIVPMGAKGGFVLKRPPAGKDRKALQEEGIACYKILIGGLLDITDNRVGKRVVPPRNVVRRDGDDPYLVVAADKGTATFSDIANTISHNYGFWLSDAFASGGSTGYDHKDIGITARGAWESVKRHFRELNHDTQTQAFDVVGVGDMGGDVFGNGMLQSRKIRLVGAFNHVHIFCDPDPDPEATFKERERLFKAVKGWDEYDQKKLSKGGRIFSRADKSLTLTPEIMKRFDITREKVTPYELIKAMLRARTDLLFFGGIGTYLKATRESHADAGDKANDPLRINAAELRAQVIGEGANLAMTQLSRIEFAEKGGRLNTDFIDNSAGVDCSDHEVNIKILLNEVMSGKKHKLTMGARNRLLEDMTDEVAALVLRDNYQQAQAISLEESQAPAHMRIHAEFIGDLEREQGLNRALEGLPDDEAVQQRLRLNRGLTRPELAILIAYAKITFTRDLLVSDIPDAPEMQQLLQHYFPVPLQKKFGKEIPAHRLAREIIATGLAGGLVNRMGPTFVKSRMIKTGASCAEVARAYIVACEAFGLHKIWGDIEALDARVPAQVQLRAMRETAALCHGAITWFLTRLGRDLNISKDSGLWRTGVERLESGMDGLLTDEIRAAVALRTEAGMADGLPEDLARRIALMPVLGSACDIVRIAADRNYDLSVAARTYFELGEHFHMDWLRQQARYLQPDDRWTSEALDGLIDQLYSCQAGLTVRILHDLGKKDKNSAGIVNRWLEAHAHQAGQIMPLFADLRRAGTIDLPMLIIAEQKLRNLYGG